jgi:predicted DNA-binding transcriptional regulator AlpA
LSLVQAAEQVISKLLALCVRLSNSEKAQPASAIQPIPQYVDEERVAEITGMSRVWFQRARSEGIGPRWVKIARRVAYPLADVVQWIESGAAAREHLSSRGPKKGKRSPKEGL